LGERKKKIGADWQKNAESFRDLKRELPPPEKGFPASKRKKAKKKGERQTTLAEVSTKDL